MLRQLVSIETFHWSVSDCGRGCSRIESAEMHSHLHLGCTVSRSGTSAGKSHIVVEGGHNAWQRPYGRIGPQGC